MNVDELQQAILAKVAGNGPVTDQMKKTVYDNIWHDSLAVSYTHLDVYKRQSLSQ